MKRLLWSVGAAAAAALLVGLMACGNDGRAQMYEDCSDSVRCADSLACIDGACTAACAVTLSVPPQTGECHASGDCEDLVVGCCKITATDENKGQGYCTVHP